MIDKRKARLRRARKTRARIFRLGVVRLSVTRSLNHIYAQLVSPCGSKVLASASTLEGDIRSNTKNGGNKEAAVIVGKLIAKRALDLGVKQIAFDRSGYKYHGRIKSLAEAAREAGLEF